MHSSILHYVYCLPLANVVVVMFIGVILWTSASMMPIFKKLWRILNILGVFVSLVGILLSTILLRKAGTDGSLILRPLISFIYARFQPEIYRTMLMNCFVFFPLGLSLPAALGDRKYRVIISFLSAFFLSTGIEVIQYIFSLGRAEVDDIICNVFGAVIGMIPYGIIYIKQNR